MKLLVISLAGIGDTLFATPLIHELRLNFPDAEIDALVRWKGSADLLQGNPHVNTVHQMDLPAARKGEALRFLWGLRQRAYDATLNTFPQSRVHYGLVARLIAAPLRISHDYGNVDWTMPWLVNRVKRPDYSIHCVENNLALLGFLNARPRLDRHAYEIFLTETETRWADGYIHQHHLEGRILLGIHVGSGSTKNLALRRWPLAHYTALIGELLGADSQLAVLLFGGPEEEKDHAQLLATADRGRVFAPETRNFRQAVALLKKCRLFLSVDTSLMHLAAAAGVPGQVVIETPTWNKTVEPRGRPYRLVPNPAVAGRNLEFYRYDGRGIQGTEEEIVRCMKSVTVESVASALRESLAQAGA
jgi:heptosyltransferase-3